MQHDAPLPTSRGVRYSGAAEKKGHAMRAVLLCLFWIAATPAFAAEQHRIVGAWKLGSVIVEDMQTKERRALTGANPRGYQVATPEGRWMAIVSTETRTAPKNDQERLQNLRTLIAYGGTYRVADDKIVTKLDVASNEAWIGTEQTIDLKFESDDVMLFEMPPELHPGDAKKRVRAIITWRRDRP